MNQISKIKTKDMAKETKIKSNEPKTSAISSDDRE